MRRLAVIAAALVLAAATASVAAATPFELGPPRFVPVPPGTSVIDAALGPDGGAALLLETTHPRGATVRVLARDRRGERWHLSAGRFLRAYAPATDIDADGRAIVAWRRGGRALSSTLAGGRWSPAVTVPLRGPGSEVALVDRAAGGGATFAARECAGRRCEVGLTRQYGPRLPWSQPETLSVAADAADVALGRDGAALAAWATPSGTVEASLHPIGSSAWPPAAVVSSAATPAAPDAAAVSAELTPATEVVAWSSAGTAAGPGAPAAPALAVRPAGAATFEPARLLASNVDVDTLALGAGEAGDVAVAWSGPETGRPAGPSRFRTDAAVRSAGGEWTALPSLWPVELALPVYGYSRAPCRAMVLGGDVVVAWTVPEFKGDAPIGGVASRPLPPAAGEWTERVTGPLCLGGLASYPEERAALHALGARNGLVVVRELADPLPRPPRARGIAVSGGRRAIAIRIPRGRGSVLVSVEGRPRRAVRMGSRPRPVRIGGVRPGLRGVAVQACSPALACGPRAPRRVRVAP